MPFRRLQRPAVALTRRAYLRGAALSAVGSLVGDLAAGEATPVEPAALRAFDLELAGERTVARKARVLVSTDSALVNTRTPVLVLLHGLGETGNESLALRAWPQLYGLITSVNRLMSPPVQRTLPNQRYLSDARLKDLNAGLAHEPFVPPVLVCPVTPRPASHENRARLFDRYAAWIEEVLLPAVRERVPNVDGPVGLDGCSMGGYVASEVFIRRPNLFQSFGMVQAAIAEWRVPELAKRLADVARSSPARVRVASSSDDPFRPAAETLSAELRRLGVEHQLSISAGPHNQLWLREVATLDLLDWHRPKLA
jgi:pimeloyl-ACP methyl ester carboxylesterase